MSSGYLKIYNGIEYKPVSADPSSPVEGMVQFSDGTHRTKGLWQYVNGAWEQTGGGSGTGGINYIENSDFETNADGWNSYDDGSVTIPVDGTGDTAANLTITRQDISPLRGSGMLQFSKSSVDAQGEGVSYDFTIDRADKSKKLTISFDYNTATSNYTDGDVKIFVYDVDNSSIIRVNGEDLLGGASTHYAQFQTSATSNNYRLIFHITTTTTTGFTLWFDNVKVGPTNLAFGTPTTGAIDISSDITFSAFGASPTIDKAYYYRNGELADIVMQVTLGNVPTGTMKIILPSYLPINTSKALVFESNSVSAKDTNAGGIYDGDVLIESSSTISFRGDDGVVSWNATTPFTWAATDVVYIKLRVPITGWSSNTQMSEDLGGRDIVLELKTDGTLQSLPNNTVTKLTVFSAPVTDTISGWNSTTNEYSIPETGYYDLSFGVRIGVDADNDMIRAVALIFVNGVEYKSSEKGTYTGSSGQISPNLAVTGAKLNKGDLISFRAYQQNTDGDSLNISSSGAYTYAYVAKRSSSQTILETETVAARYNSNSGQTVASNTVIIYEDLVKDTHNAYNTSTGIYTTPVPGWYVVSAKCRTNVATNIALGIEVNGVDVDDFSNADTGDDSSTAVMGIIYLNKGDTVEVVNNTGASRTLNTASQQNVFSIVRIK